MVIANDMYDWVSNAVGMCLLLLIWVLGVECRNVHEARRKIIDANERCKARDMNL
jgi:hypothetical protein